ncbi:MULTISPECIES: hypothetical protein [Neisseria]|uniref:hypothetical protein n=1 Tax=Neisseria TaxID=482 RepID=UPI00107172FB|nr:MULTISPECIES: hypothetical protein [Neisseria]MBF0803051.1 hypothetical protein [Neisseria sp. 19428wB4_WF04]TFU44342.1 hypothetical protein E4T99_01535 [Neisseria sp. WF04]
MEPTLLPLQWLAQSLFELKRSNAVTEMKRDALKPIPVCIYFSIKNRKLSQCRSGINIKRIGMLTATAHHHYNAAGCKQHSPYQAGQDCVIFKRSAMFSAAQSLPLFNSIYFTI